MSENRPILNYVAASVPKRHKWIGRIFGSASLVCFSLCAFIDLHSIVGTSSLVSVNKGMILAFAVPLSGTAFGIIGIRQSGINALCVLGLVGNALTLLLGVLLCFAIFSAG